MQPTNTRLPQVIGDRMAQISDIRSGRDDIVTIKWVVSIIGLLILSAGCVLSLSSPEYEEMEANLERWKSHGITNYRMRFQINCFCIQDTLRAKIVDVRNGFVHWAVYEHDGTPVSLSDVRGVHSIDSLFILIEESLGLRQTDYVVLGLQHADYNAEYGYLEVVAFDSDSSTDMYIDYKVELLVIMEEDTDVSVHKTSVETARTMYGEMVSISADTFRMGDLSGEGYDGEKPVHRVTVPAFKLGKYEVTFAQWDACVADGGCNGYKPYGSSRGGSLPVSGISWDDTQSFIDWLNSKTGGNYRLPTEAEWEYAARAGSTTEYSWGDDIGSNRANCDTCGSQWDDSWTAPVGSFPANAWGLHDMHGNVAEWVQDCWNDNYKGAPTDGSVWTRGKCDKRVIRGGSCVPPPVPGTTARTAASLSVFA